MKDKSKQIKPLKEQVGTVEASGGAALKTEDGSLAADKILPKHSEKPKPEAKIQEKEINGPKGLEPTRYGDWESKGRCYDF